METKVKTEEDWEKIAAGLASQKSTRELTAGEKKKLKSYNLPSSAKEHIEKAWKSRKNPEDQVSWWGLGIGYLLIALCFLFPVILLWKVFGAESFSTLGAWGALFYNASAFAYWVALAIIALMDLVELGKRDVFSPWILRYAIKRSFVLKAFSFVWDSVLMPVVLISTGHYVMLVLYVVVFIMLMLIQKEEKKLVKDFFPDEDEGFIEEDSKIESACEY
ncbi:MAG: hypothetical protein LBD11_08540 [Candidatus Peribacteria bacterium]|jgi:hypothetical protein|nr:hypothetical protein [Candidatus Peribacteria bacterium]